MSQADERKPRLGCDTDTLGNTREWDYRSPSRMDSNGAGGNDSHVPRLSLIWGEARPGDRLRTLERSVSLVFVELGEHSRWSNIRDRPP